MVNTYRVFVCPDCGWAETKPWDECWHVCGEPAYHPQGFDPSRDSEIPWTRMFSMPLVRAQKTTHGQLAYSIEQDDRVGSRIKTPAHKEHFGCPACDNIRLLPAEPGEEPPWCIHHDGEYVWRKSHTATDWTRMVRLDVTVRDSS